MNRLLVTHCICHSRSFEEIKELASEQNLSTVEELQAEDLCSNSCQMCEPYVELMLETGETAFEPGAYLIRDHIS